MEKYEAPMAEVVKIRTDIIYASGSAKEFSLFDEEDDSLTGTY